MSVRHPSRFAALAALAALFALSALAGCTVGPNYAPPKLATPAAFAEADPAVAAAPAPDLTGWWHAYRDPLLDRLVDRALADSPDVKTAVARIAEARAQERIARAQGLPEISATGGPSAQRFSKNAGFASLAQAFSGGGGGSGGGGSGGSGGGGGVALPGGFIKTYSVGFDASWEIDLFGGVRRQVQGARARAAAAEWSARDAQLSLVAEVVDDYLQLRLAQAREAVARAEVDRQARTLQIMGENAQVGLTPQGDTVRQRAQLAQAQASVGPIVAAGKAEMHAIATLIGRTPDALILELSAPGPALPAPPPVPPGLPSDLLRRRPDVRAAEQNLAAATTDIGVAVADLYPRLSLTGMGQLISTALGNLFTTDSAQIMANAAATFPVLDFGRRKGQVAVRRAEADQAYYQYQRTVLGALRDVEDALIRIRTEQERNAVLRAGVADAERATAAVTARYRTGLVDLTAVLDAQATVLSDRDQLTQSDAALRRDLVSLYKALGGGWEGLALPAATPAAYTAPRARR